MREAKVIGLGIFFSFVGFVALLVISIVRGPVSFESCHAAGLSAVVAGMIEALFSPITLLVIVVAFVAATWLTRKTSKKQSHIAKFNDAFGLTRLELSSLI